MVRRVATARGAIIVKRSTVDAVVRGEIKKGDVVSASKLAGIQAAKATSSILPLCHQIPLTSVTVELAPKEDRIEVECTVSAEYKTGVEMEALVGATAALLNVWDMVKYLEKDENGQYPGTMISDVRVVEKKKGK